MPYEREHRLDDRKIRDLLRNLECADCELEVPGKRTHTQLVWTIGRLVSRNPSSTLSAEPGRTMPRAPQLGFHDFQALALRDVLSRLGQRPDLREATLAAADPEVARRVAKRECRLTTPIDRQAHSPQGQGMWRAAKRRAVTLYRRALSTGTVALETPAVAAALASIGSGVPLDPAVCRNMEGILGVRLDRVGIHTGVVARDAANAANADAFTVGEDIFFPSYDPNSESCQKLLLHELVHCCQWWQGRIRPSGSGVGVSQPSDALEQEAEAVVARAPIGLLGRERDQWHRLSAGELPPHARESAAPVENLFRGTHPSRAGVIDGEGTPFRSALVPTPVATKPVAPPMLTARGVEPQMVMRQAKSEEAQPKPDLPGRELFPWIDTFLKGEYRWQIVIQDLFRSSLWIPQEVVEEVAGEYADFISQNMDLILGSLAVFLAAGAGAVFLSGAAAALCKALLVGFGIAGLVVATKAMLKHAEQWLRLVRRANGKPEGIAAASKEFLQMITSFAIAVEASSGALNRASLAGSLVRWLRTRIATPKRPALDDPNVIQTVQIPKPDGADVDVAYGVPGHRAGSASQEVGPHNHALAPPIPAEVLPSQPNATAAVSSATGRAAANNHAQGLQPSSENTPGIEDVRVTDPTTGRRVLGAGQQPQLTEAAEWELLAKTPMAGTSPSMDLKGGRGLAAGGDNQEVQPQGAIGQDLSEAPMAKTEGNKAWVGSRSWRPFKTAGGDYLLYISERNLKVLNLVKDHGLTRKEIKRAMGVHWPPKTCARAFELVVNKALQVALREANAAPENIGGVVFDTASRKYVFRDPAELQQAKNVQTEYAALTTNVRRRLTIVRAGEVWINASPIQHAILTELVRRNTWKRTEIQSYVKNQWGHIVGDVKLQHQLEKLRIAVNFARRGPNTTDQLVNAGEIITGKEEVRFNPPPPLLPVTFGRVEYWFQIAPTIQATLAKLSQSDMWGIPLGPHTAKAVRVALSNARLKDDIGAPAHLVGTLELVKGSEPKAYVVDLTTPNKQKPPTGDQLRKLIGKMAAP